MRNAIWQGGGEPGFGNGARSWRGFRNRLVISLAILADPNPHDAQRQRRFGLQPRVGPRNEDLPWDTEMRSGTTAKRLRLLWIGTPMVNPQRQPGVKQAATALRLE